MFTGISEIEKKELTKQLDATYYSFKEGLQFLSYIPAQGCIAIVDKGKVDVIRVNENGEQMVFDVLNENDLFCMDFYGTEDMLELVAQKDVRILLIDNKKIADFSIENMAYRQFLKNYSQKLTKKIVSMNERISYLSCKTIRSKLLMYFKSQGNLNHSQSFSLPFSYSVLANYLAMDRSAMNRELKNLKDERIIKTQGRKVTLLLKDFI